MTSRLTHRLILCCAALLPLGVNASSHREAPAIAGLPRVDGTDFYLFRSYEAGRSGYVTFIANYIPLQDPEGGPNFYDLDPHALYSIHLSQGKSIDNLSFNFQFTNVEKGLAVNAGGKSVPIALINDGAVTPAGTNLNVVQSYTITVRYGGRDYPAQNVSSGGAVFYKPADNIGTKSIPDYESYAAQFIYQVSWPGCATPGRVFVGQRKDGFVANLGEIFDLVNLNPVGPRDGQPNTLAAKNVTSIALELPISCLATSSSSIVGAYTTASIATSGSPSVAVASDWMQVSRLGMPLVNELVIGLPDKDAFNASSPVDDAQFLTYVTNPTVPVLLNALFGKAALVPGTPRNDLVAAFLTGVKGINQPTGVRPAEMLRLNTAIAPTPPASQNDLGVLGGDLAGYPNGRRPYDDVVDITLRVAEGALCGVIGSCGSETSDPNGGAPYTDGARAAGPDAAHETLGGQVKASDTYLDVFPYLNSPIPGSPNGQNGTPAGTVTP